MVLWVEGLLVFVDLRDIFKTRLSYSRLISMIHSTLVELFKVPNLITRRTKNVCKTKEEWVLVRFETLHSKWNFSTDFGIERLKSPANCAKMGHKEQDKKRRKATA